ncbi:MAG: MarR family transcriptional regulator [Gammaproteobacteria bacterium]|nr:MarR family transcriptional regulator [Gammaproteobacteria bacterium]
MEEEPPDRNFGLILHDVARLLRTNFDRRVRDLGLTRSQWWVLTHLYHQDGLTQTELSELMEIERPSLGRLLDRLEAKNWIRRDNDPNDRRVNRVYLTLDVKPMVRQMRQHASAVRHQALAGLGEDRREQLIDTLLLIKQNLQETDAVKLVDQMPVARRARR